MSELFLSASVPIVGRGNYHETADPFLIQTAVRELVIAIIRKHRLVWGGHPSITPMVWAICESLDVNYADSVVLYQSRYFDDRFPEENAKFGNVIYVDAVEGDREASLAAMREAMLSRPELAAAVFIGGMEGVEEEFRIFRRLQPLADYLMVTAPGGAALQLGERLDQSEAGINAGVDFATMFQSTVVGILNRGPQPEELLELQRRLRAELVAALQDPSVQRAQDPPAIGFEPPSGQQLTKPSSDGE